MIQFLVEFVQKTEKNRNKQSRKIHETLEKKNIDPNEREREREKPRYNNAKAWQNIWRELQSM